MPPYTLEHPVPTDIHTRFSALRSRLQIPQSELARWLGVSSSQLRLIESGRQLPTGNVARLLDALETRSVSAPLLMHEPASEKSKEPEPIVTLPPHALAALDTFQTEPPPTLVPLKETEGAIALPEMNEEPSIADRVRAVREHFGITRPRLASWMGVSRQYVTNIENGKRISAPVLKLIERLEQDIRDQQSTPADPEPSATPTEAKLPEPDVSVAPPAPAPAPLPEPEKQPIVFRPRLAAIPLLSLREAHGIDLPEHADRLALEHFAFTVGDPHAFALRLTGDAMSPQHIEGELAIVYPHTQPHTGDRVIARLQSGQSSEVVFRIYGTADQGGTVVLSSLNPTYPPITVRRDEVVWIYPVAATVRHLLG
jgi:DNA-binding transcriptional regulator YiaG